jgi:hypothetical protein
LDEVESPAPHTDPKLNQIIRQNIQTPKKHIRTTYYHLSLIMAEIVVVVVVVVTRWNI